MGTSESVDRERDRVRRQMVGLRFTGRGLDASGLNPHTGGLCGFRRVHERPEASSVGAGLVGNIGPYGNPGRSEPEVSSERPVYAYAARHCLSLRRGEEEIDGSSRQVPWILEDRRFEEQL